MKALAAFLALCALPLCASGQALWQKTSYGMTLKQVQAVVPQAAVPKEPSHLNGNVLEHLRIENYAVVGKPFVVRFYFEADKLVQVMLEALKEDSLIEYSSTFDALAEVLRAKYGVERSKKNRDNSLSMIHESTWVDGKTDITLLLTSAGDTSSGAFTLLNVVYSTNLSKEAERL
jgi:hypothetical protein